jgi:predicted nucleic acid-binding protein
VSLTAIYDANVFYPAPLRDLLIRLAQTTLVRARWTEQILDECFANLATNRPDLERWRLQRTRALINEAVRDGLVTGHESLVPDLSLPDAEDRHVLAAAIHAGAQVIVTFNLQHFPRRCLDAYEIEALHPDGFVLRLIDVDLDAILRVLNEQEAALRRPEPLDLIARLERQGLSGAAAALRPYRPF